MNTFARTVIRNEKGAAMALAVILLLVAGLITASLLSFMGTGLRVGPVYEGRVAELYAADAGIEDAVWKIQNSVVGDEIYELYCGQGNHTLSYNISDVNDNRVDVVVAYVDPFTYLVKSTASGDGSGTQVEAYVAGTYEFDDYSGILEQVLTSQGQFYCPEQKVCDCGGNLAQYVDPDCGEQNGPEANYDGAWPNTTEEIARFIAFYWRQVKNGTHYASPIDPSGNNMTLGAGYADDALTIVENSRAGQEGVPVLKLEGTLYIAGRAQINPTQEMILDLNRQTIFVESSSMKSVDGEYALWIGAGGGGQNTKLKIKGPGIIIAIGDIYFAPGEQLGGEEYPIFIFSVLGKAELQPGGDFAGAVAAGDRVELKSNNSIDYPDGGFGGYGLNFPGFSGGALTYGITSWQVTPLAPSEQ